MVSSNSWVMVDLETTGTHPEHSAIIQIAAVRFNPFHLTVDAECMFSRCLLVPDHRYWSEDTRRWWGQQKRETLQSIHARMEDPETVLRDFVAWVPEQATFVSKPLSFDAPFVSSYLRDYELPNPFAYWKARDLRSLIQGLTWNSEFDERAIAFEGPQHDALFDVLHQIKLLFRAIQQSQVIPCE